MAVFYRLPSDPKNPLAPYKPILTGSLKIYDTNKNLLAYSTHRLNTDVAGEKSEWGDIKLVSNGNIVGKIYYGEDINLVASVYLDEDFVSQYTTFYFEYSIRNPEVKYFATPHYDLVLESLREENETDLDKRLNIMHSLVEFLRPAHIVIKVVLRRKYSDEVKIQDIFEIKEMLYFYDAPFSLYATGFVLFDRKDYGQDEGSNYQYPGDRSGGFTVGLLVDTMEADDTYPENDYGTKVRLLAVEKNIVFDILDGYNSVHNILGFPISKNNKVVIGTNEAPFVMPTDKTLYLDIGEGTYKYLFTVDIPAGTYKAEQIANIMRPQILSHYSWHKRGLEQLVLMTIAPYYLPRLKLFAIGGITFDILDYPNSAHEILGFPLGNGYTEVLGSNFNNFDLRVNNILRFIEHSEDGSKEILVELDNAILSRWEVIKSYRRALSVELYNALEYLTIEPQSPFDEEFTLALKRDGGIYGGEVPIDNRDIDYLYRGMSFPNLRNGINYLRGRLKINVI